MKSVRGCLGKAELDLHTIDLDNRRCLPARQPGKPPKCPLCGSRKVAVIFDVPAESAAMRIAGMPSR
jgi:hypothetical protein